MHKSEAFARLNCQMCVRQLWQRSAAAKSDFEAMWMDQTELILDLRQVSYCWTSAKAPSCHVNLYTPGDSINLA